MAMVPSSDQTGVSIAPGCRRWSIPQIGYLAGRYATWTDAETPGAEKPKMSVVV